MRPNSGENGLAGNARPDPKASEETNWSPHQALDIVHQPMTAEPILLTTTCQTDPVHDPCILCLALTYHPQNLGLPLTLMCKIMTPKRAHI